MPVSEVPSGCPDAAAYDLRFIGVLLGFNAPSGKTTYSVFHIAGSRKLRVIKLS